MRDAKQAYKMKVRTLTFCNRECKRIYTTKAVTVECGWCNQPVTRLLAEFNSSVSGHMFCNQSCAASFNNTKKRKSRRSKCESLLFELLQIEFPELVMFSNDKTLLHGLELDIAIPSLSLGIEWNGVVHFKPIYGEEKLLRIQENDQRKLEVALEEGIQVIVIPDLMSSRTFVYETFKKVARAIRVLMI